MKFDVMTFTATSTSATRRGRNPERPAANRQALQVDLLVVVLRARHRLDTHVHVDGELTEFDAVPLRAAASRACCELPLLVGCPDESCLFCL